MDIVIQADAESCGKLAAERGAATLKQIIAQRGSARIVVATGASQFHMFAALVSAPDLDWSKVTGFHLDEYIGLAPDHPASFCRYLKERFVDHVPLADFHFIRGDVDDAAAECQRVGQLLQSAPIDVAFVGIGENGHLAFNDPPADFQSQEPYLIVQLDEACRRQQLGEGWFASLEEVPQQAISMSMRQILKSANIICTVPDRRKAQAVQRTVEGPVTPDVPASILQSHEQTTLFLDKAAASFLRRQSDSSTR